LEEAIRLSRESGDSWSLAHALNGIGDFLRESGEVQAPADIYKQAFGLVEELEDRGLTAWPLEGLGRCLNETNQYENLEYYIANSVALFGDMRDKENATELLTFLIDYLQLQN
jgi:hypothetical protein